MNKDEARLSVIGAISMALKNSTLQQGFEIICKNLSELEKENAELKCFIKDLIHENSNRCFQFSNTTCLFNSDYRYRAEELIGERL